MGNLVPGNSVQPGKNISDKNNCLEKNAVNDYCIITRNRTEYERFVLPSNSTSMDNANDYETISNALGMKNNKNTPPEKTISEQKIPIPDEKDIEQEQPKDNDKIALIVERLNKLNLVYLKNIVYYIGFSLTPPDVKRTLFNEYSNFEKEAKNIIPVKKSPLYELVPEESKAKIKLLEQYFPG